MKNLFIAIVSICIIVWTRPSSARAMAADSVAQAKSTSWQTPPPPYPIAAMEKGVEGRGLIRVTTDRLGNVAKAVVVEKSAAILDLHTVSFARKHWKGPPNSSGTFPFVYQIDREKPPGPPNDAKFIGPGWLTPRPPYPAKAMAARAQGHGVFRISTNRDGRVDKVEIIEKIHPLLDGHTAGFVRAHWTGPPNRTRDVPVAYQLK